MGKNHDDGHLRLGQSIEGDNGLGHLHQRKRALLHASATGRRQDDERDALLRSVLARPGQLLANHRTHRTAHEREVHDRGDTRHAANLELGTHDRLVHARLGLGLTNAIDVGLEVGELQRVGGAQI